jgi:hypothetical protein
VEAEAERYVRLLLRAAALLLRSEPRCIENAMGRLPSVKISWAAASAGSGAGCWADAPPDDEDEDEDAACDDELEEEEFADDEGVVDVEAEGEVEAEGKPVRPCDGARPDRCG